MPKGNHVFNHYDKTVDNAFAGLLEATGLTVPAGTRVYLVAAKSTPSSADAIVIAARLPKAWPKFLEIVGARPFKEDWDKMQDDEPVGPDDANSQAYGRAVASFIAEVRKIADATKRGTARPGKFWEDMIQCGYDPTAATNYIGSGPKKAEREALVDATKQWIKTTLNGLVTTWIQYMKLDMDGKK
jgi:hypothetical protein